MRTEWVTIILPDWSLLIGAMAAAAFSIWCWLEVIHEYRSRKLGR